MEQATRYSGKFFHSLILGAILFVFWMVVSPGVSIINITLGLVMSALTIIIANSLIDSELALAIPFTFLLNIPRFILLFIPQIIEANIDVALIVINPKLPIEPRIFPYKSNLTGDLEKTFLTYCINLTPGTVVVDIQDDVFYVHCLTGRHQDGLTSGTLEKMVTRLFNHQTRDTEETRRLAL